MQLGDRIRDLRDSLGLTQKELGDLAHTTSGHIHKIESGRATDMKLSTLRGIADALRTTLDPLVYGDGPQKQAELRAIEDELLELGKQPDSESLRKKLRELSARAAELSSGVKYRPLPQTDGTPSKKRKKRRGPKPGSKPKRPRPER